MIIRDLFIIIIGGDFMELNKTDYLKKALLDTQERIRDFQAYSSRIEDKSLQDFFSEYALSECKQAQKLQEYIKTENN